MPADKYIKIGGVEVNYSQAASVTFSHSSSAPAQATFEILQDYSADLPAIGKTVEIFLRDDTKVFGGTVDQVDWDGLVESGPRIRVSIKAVGFDTRLRIRTTWDRLGYARTPPAEYCAKYESYTGTVTVDGSSVLWATGDKFGQELVGKVVVLTSGNHTVLTVPSPEKMTVSGSPAAGAWHYTVWSGDVVKDLLSNTGKYCDYEGFTYDTAATTIQDGAAIDHLSFDPPIPIAEAIQKLLELNPTFYFSVDPDQECYFAVRSLVPAPADFTDATAGTVFKKGIKGTLTREDVRNAEISIVAWEAVPDTVQTVTGAADGLTRSWFLDLPIGQMGTLKLRGVETSVGDETGEDGSAEFRYEQNTGKLWQDPLNLVSLVVADEIEVTYKRLGGNIIQYDDEAARAARATAEGTGLGRIEEVIDRTTSKDRTAAQVEAEASVNRLKGNSFSNVIITRDPGYRVGQLVNVDIVDRKVAEDLIIDAISATDDPVKGYADFEYTLTCLSPERRITSADVLRALFGIKGEITGGATISAGLPSPPGALDFDPFQGEYGYAGAEHISVTDPRGILGIDFYLISIDELISDPATGFWYSMAGVDGSTDPVDVVVAINPNYTGALVAVIGDWVLFNDAGAFEWGQITGIDGDTWTIQRHWPGDVDPAAATFGSLIAAHDSDVKLFICPLAGRRFVMPANNAGFDTASVPDTFDFHIPGHMVGAIVGAPFNAGGYGTWVVRNLATATLPGLRTCVGGVFTFQYPGDLAVGADVGTSLQVPFDQPTRVRHARVDGPPAGADLKVRIRRSINGGTTWSTVEDLTISAGDKNSWGSGNPPGGMQAPYSGSWPFRVLFSGTPSRPADLLNYSIIQVGSSDPGSGLTVEVET